MPVRAATGASVFGQVLAKRETERVLEYLDRKPGEPAEWRNAAVPAAATIPLSAAELVHIKDRWSQVLAPYLAQAEANDAQLQPGQRYVRFFLAASPLPDLDLGESEVDTDT